LRATVVEWKYFEELPLTESGVDVLASRMSRTPRREARLTFTCPTIVYPPAVITRAGDEPFDSGDIPRRLGAQFDTTNAELAQRLLTDAYGSGGFESIGPLTVQQTGPLGLEGPSLVTYDGNETDHIEVGHLLDNQIDGIVVDYPFANVMVSETPGANGNVRIDALLNENPEQIAYAMRGSERALADRLNAAIRANPARIAEFHAQVCGSSTGAEAICRMAVCL
jgi:ABC-type amino acid transport substrate-binding protein